MRTPTATASMVSRISPRHSDTRLLLPRSRGAANQSLHPPKTSTLTCASQRMRLATSVIAARLPAAMTATTRRVVAPCPPTAMTGMFFPSSRAQAICSSVSWPSSNTAFTAPRPSTTTTTRMTMGPSTPDPTSSSPASTRVLRRPRSLASLRSMARLRSARS